jgi:hypothetical protein
MRRISIAIALTTVLLASVGSAQQTTSNVSPDAQQGGSLTPPPGPIIGGMGTTNYIPIWASSDFLRDSVIYQANGNVGIGTTTPAANLDVDGNVNSASGYEIGGSSVLSIGNAADHSLYLGIGAGINNVQGTDNTFTGYLSGNSNDQGDENTFYGGFSGYSNIAGDKNTFVGASAGYNSTTGRYNSFFGTYAGESNTVGGGNTFAGFQAGAFNTTGSFNTFYGTQAGAYNRTGSNNVYIVNVGSPNRPSESNTIRIGTQGTGKGQQNAAYIAGIYDVNVGGVPVQINANGQLGAATSSLRFKEQVRDMGDSTSALMKLRPVTFLYKPEYDKGERTIQYGLIAEEVAKVYPELVAYDNDGQPYSVRYQYLSTMLLNEVQKQYRRAEAEAKVITTQQDQIQALQEQNREFQERLLRLEKLVPQTVARR